MGEPTMTRTKQPEIGSRSWLMEYARINLNRAPATPSSSSWTVPEESFLGPIRARAGAHRSAAGGHVRRWGQWVQIEWADDFDDLVVNVLIRKVSL